LTLSCFDDLPRASSIPCQYVSASIAVSRVIDQRQIDARKPTIRRHPSRIPQWIFGQGSACDEAIIDPRDIALPKRIGRNAAGPSRFELDEREKGG
jgi:hypothetical protein